MCSYDNCKQTIFHVDYVKADRQEGRKVLTGMSPKFTQLGLYHARLKILATQVLNDLT